LIDVVVFSPIVLMLLALVACTALPLLLLWGSGVGRLALASAGAVCRMPAANQSPRCRIPQQSLRSTTRRRRTEEHWAFSTSLRVAVSSRGSPEFGRVSSR